VNCHDINLLIQEFAVFYIKKGHLTCSFKEIFIHRAKMHCFA
jgi:hypothetical protein